MTNGQVFWFGFFSGGIVVGGFIGTILCWKLHRVEDKLNRMNVWHKRFQRHDS